MYFVKSIFSDVYTSINTIDYYQKLNLVEKPWYYEYYQYKLHTEKIDIPCSINMLPVTRSQLNIFDRELYYLHILAIKDYKKNNNFYWYTNSNLEKKFDNLWVRILKENHDKIH